MKFSQIQPKVSIGFTTIFGIILGVLPGLIVIIIKAVEEGEAITVQGPEKWLALITVVSTAIILIMRYLQAVIQQKVPPQLISPPPSAQIDARISPVLAGDQTKLDMTRAMLAEHPEFVQTLRGEGVIQ